MQKLDSLPKATSSFVPVLPTEPCASNEYVRIFSKCMRFSSTYRAVGPRLVMNKFTGQLKNNTTT